MRRRKMELLVRELVAKQLHISHLVKTIGRKYHKNNEIASTTTIRIEHIKNRSTKKQHMRASHNNNLLNGKGTPNYYFQNK